MDVTREEAELLTGLDRRAGQDDPSRLPPLEMGDRFSHCEVGLPCPCRADGEDDIVLLDRLDIPPLADSLRADLLTPMGHLDHISEDPFQVGPLLGLLHEVADLLQARNMVIGDDIEQTVEKVSDQLCLFPLDEDPLAPGDDLDLRELLLDIVKVPVQLPEEGCRFVLILEDQLTRD